MKIWLALGSFFAFLSVALGAFGAHVLETRLDERMLGIFKTAAQYQMYHALALILFSHSALAPSPSRPTPAIGWCFTLGILFFSGSLYALTMTNISLFGAVTPFGGVFFLLGWALWGASSLKKKTI